MDLVNSGFGDNRVLISCTYTSNPSH